MIHASRLHPRRFVACIFSAASLCVLASPAAPFDPFDDDDRERLLVVAPDGAVVATLEGDGSHVPIDPDVDGLLSREGAALTLTHNHPRNSGLSGEDLQQLAKRGVVRIEAIARDGSRYQAVIGPAFDRERFLQRQYAVALEAVAAGRPRSIPAPTFDSYIAHLASLALHRARIIVYSVELSDARVWPYHEHALLFEGVVFNTAARLRRR